MKTKEIRLPKKLSKCHIGTYYKYEKFSCMDHSKDWAYEMHVECTPEEAEKLFLEKGSNNE